MNCNIHIHMSNQKEIKQAVSETSAPKYSKSKEHQYFQFIPSSCRGHGLHCHSPIADRGTGYRASGTWPPSALSWRLSFLNAVSWPTLLESAPARPLKGSWRATTLPFHAARRLPARRHRSHRIRSRRRRIR